MFQLLRVVNEVYVYPNQFLELLKYSPRFTLQQNRRNRKLKYLREQKGENTRFDYERLNDPTYNNVKFPIWTSKWNFSTSLLHGIWFSIPLLIYFALSVCIKRPEFKIPVIFLNFSYRISQ